MAVEPIRAAAYHPSSLNQLVRLPTAARPECAMTASANHYPFRHSWIAGTSGEVGRERLLSRRLLGFDVLLALERKPAG